MHKKSSYYVALIKVFQKLKLNPWKAPARMLNKELLSKLKVIGLQFCQAGPPNMNCFKGFAKTISFLFYIFEIYKFSIFHFWNLCTALRNMLLQILLIESIFYKKADEWYIDWQRVITSDKVFQERSSKKVAGVNKDLLSKIVCSI